MQKKIHTKIGIVMMVKWKCSSLEYDERNFRSLREDFRVQIYDKIKNQSDIFRKLKIARWTDGRSKLMQLQFMVAKNSKPIWIDFSEAENMHH